MKLPMFTIRGFKKPREVLIRSLGKLEREVMRVAWSRGEISVRDVFLDFDEQVAYTTLMTKLQRLHRKGILRRRKQGRAFWYAPRLSHTEFEHGIARDLIDGLISRTEHGVEPLLACLVDAVGEHDRRSLDALDRLIREKRQK